MQRVFEDARRQPTDQPTDRPTSTLIRFPLRMCPLRDRIACCASCSFSMCCTPHVLRYNLWQLHPPPKVGVVYHVSNFEDA